jgi:hypothetical protein
LAKIEEVMMRIKQLIGDICAEKFRQITELYYNLLTTYKYTYIRLNLVERYADGCTTTTPKNINIKLKDCTKIPLILPVNQLY